MWMNRMDVEDAVDRYKNHAVLGIAARFLSDFVEEVDSVSDGWPYWKLPSNAAKKLMELIQKGGNPTMNDLKKSLVPIKSFMTTHGSKVGMKMPPLY